MSINVDIKNYFARAENILNEIDTLSEDYKELMQEAKANGIDCKALKAALKEKRKPLDPDFKKTVNLYLEIDGQYQLFNA